MASDAPQPVSRPPESAPKAPQTAHGRGILRWLGFGAAATALGCFLAWFSFPYVVPGLIDHYIPEGWTVDISDLDRPGLSDIRLGTLKATNNLGGMRLEYEASDLTIAYPELALNMGSLKIFLLENSAPVATDSSSSGFHWQEFALPRITLAGDIPAVRIQQLSLHDRRNIPESRWDFEGLVLTPDGESLAIALDLGQSLSTDDELTLALELNPWRLEARLMTQGESNAPWVSYTQESTPGSSRGLEATAQLNWSLDLAMLGRNELLPLAGLGKHLLGTQASGMLTGQLNFSGIDSLQPIDGTFGFEAIEIDYEGSLWRADINGALERDANGLNVDLNDLSVSADKLPGSVLTAVEEAAESYGLAGLIGSEAARMEIHTPRQDSRPVSILVAEDNAISVRAPDGLQMILGQAEQFELVVDVQALEIPTLAVDNLASTEFSATLRLDGGFLNPLTHTASERQLGASTGGFSASLSVQRDANELVLDGELEQLDLTGASFSSPGITARLQTLSLTGLPRLEIGFGFTGELNGSGLIFAAEDSPLAPPLLTADSLNMNFNIVSPLEAQDPTQLSSTIVLNQVSLPIAATTADRLELQLDPVFIPENSGQLRLLTTGLTTTLGDQPRSGFDLDLAGQLSNGRVLTGDGELLLGYQAALPFAYETDLETRAGTIRLDNARLSANDLGALAKPLGLTLPQGLRFVSGDIVLNGTINASGENLGGNLDILGEDIGLALGESSLEALDFRTEINLNEILSGGGSLTLGLARLAAGLEVISLNTAIDISSGESFGLKDLGASLLGGQLSAPSLRLESGRLQSGSISWEGFDLSRLLRFVDVSGMDGTGTMDAWFPIVNEPGGIAVRDGSFAARGPGRLRYNTGIPATNIGLQALENFEYDELSGTLDYGSDGAYTLGINLLGKNPELYGGHPIRFRLNLGGAMPALFRSLFITGDFDKAIVERLRSGDPLLQPTEPAPQPDQPDQP